MDMLVRMLFLISVAIVGFLVITWAFNILDFRNAVRTLFGKSTELKTDSVVFSSLPPDQKVSEAGLDAYLQKKGGEQLKDKGAVFFRLGVKYDIDPAFAVAVSTKETSLGTKTCSHISTSCNNFFCIKSTKPKEDSTCSIWGEYASAEEGIESFYKLIKIYVNRDQDTIAEIGCAPGSGYSSPDCYCWEDGYCKSWVEGKDSIPAYTAMVRNEAA